jgi:hypothetical protein
MKKFIIEDCSPYYIRFRHDNSDEIIKILQELTVLHKRPNNSFTHYLTADEQYNVTSLGPLKDNPEMIRKMAIITVPPGVVSLIHIDVKWHLNYIAFQDDANPAVVNWYNSDLFSNYTLEYLTHGKQWIPVGYDPRVDDPKAAYTPPEAIVTAKFLQGDVVLFNSALFHDFQNRSPITDRSIMISVPADPDLTFDQAKEYFKFNSL